MLLVKQGLVETSLSRKKKKDLMKELKLVKLAVKAEDAAAKREVQKITGRRKRDEMCDESGSELSDMDTDMPTKKKKDCLPQLTSGSRDTVRRHWLRRRPRRSSE
jgi:hypothetical protein